MHTIEHQSLEAGWQKTKGAFDTMCAEESARRERVRLCLLEFEKEELEDQAAEDADRIGDLEWTVEELQSTLDTVQIDIDALRGDLASRHRDLDRLKAELVSLQDASKDSQETLSEKLALERELAKMKPELVHLRTQQTSYQELVSEKLSLQRELQSAELELDNERKGNKRVQDKESSRQAREVELQSQLDDVKGELAQETRQKQKLEREMSKSKTEAESHNAAQDSRIDALRTKLKITKEELKKTQSELEQARSSAVAATTNAAKGNGRKRNFADITAEEFSTPGAAPEKKTKRGSTQIGEKSMFSMTPFLKKTGSIAPDDHPLSSQQDQETDVAEGPEDAAADDNEGESEISDTQPIAKPSKASGRPKGSKSKPKAEPEPKKPAQSRKSAKAPDLNNVQEEEDAEEDAEAEEQADEVAKLPQAPALKLKKQAADLEDMSFIKKKRKILGGGLAKTIFDDDDAGPSTSTALGRGAVKPKGLGALSNVRLAAGGIARTAGLGGFGGFSPLKRDRKVSA